MPSICAACHPSLPVLKWQVKYMADEGEFHGRDLWKLFFYRARWLGRYGCQGSQHMLPLIVQHWDVAFRYDQYLQLERWVTNGWYFEHMEETQQKHINFNSYIYAFHWYLSSNLPEFHGDFGQVRQQHPQNLHKPLQPPEKLSVGMSLPKNYIWIFVSDVSPHQL